MTIEGILGAIVIGAVIGVLGRLVLPGKQNIPIWLTIVVGIGAALLGSLIVGNMRDTDGVDWVEATKQRKEANGLAHRDDIKTFVDFIDADEKRK